MKLVKLLNQLKIGRRLALVFFMVSAFLIFITGMIGYMISRNSLEEETFNKLLAVREMKKNEIENYFKMILNQNVTFSQNLMVVDAMREFREGYNQIGNDSSAANSDIIKFYEKEFLTRLSGDTVDSGKVQKFLPSSGARVLQNLYIVTNPNPVGEKDKLNDARDGSYYSRTHARYHPLFRDYLDKFGYYDIFLVDVKTGNIVYTVFKEVDYATSLVSGPYKDSGISHVFKEAVQAKKNSDVFFEDFRPYVPSYNKPASFIASPIFENGEMTGVLIFQLPVGRINEIMTGYGKWSDIGLGESGEMYMIGQDYTMRNDSRFLIEDPDGYFAAIQKAGVDNSTIVKIKNFESSIGLHKIETNSSNSALKGESGSWIIKDYRNVDVLSAYSPVNIAGVKWGIISEIDQSEAFAPISTLRNLLIATALVLLVVTVVVSFALGNMITKPINEVVSRIKDIAEGEGDLTQRLDESSHDELGDLSRWFNRFVVKIHDIVVDLAKTSRNVFEASSGLTESSSSLSATAEEMATQSENIASSAEEMNTSFHSLSSAVEQMSTSINEVASQAARGASISFEATGNSKEATKIIEELSDNANSVDFVADSIASISDQINLLSLNASIEAAGAGDAGKGFAVVAAEVKELARQSSEALGDVKEKLGAARTSADKTVHSIGSIDLIIQQMNEINSVIASSVEEQSITTKEIASGVAQATNVSQEVASTIAGLSDASQDVSTSSERTAQMARTLNESAEILNEIVSRFKTAESHSSSIA